MMEWVDMRDLKSLGHCGCAGSSPVGGTNSLCDGMVDMYDLGSYEEIRESSNLSRDT